MKRIDSFDGLRGILALFVAYAHAFGHITGWNSGASFVGNASFAVDVFFILSVLVLVKSFQSRLGVVSPLNAGLFVVARFLRLWPLHVAALVLTVVVFALFQHGVPSWVSKNLGRDVFFNLLMANSIGVRDVGSIVHPAWSISIEFYAGSLLVLLACWNRVVFYLVALAACVLAVKFNLRVSGADDPIIPLINAGVLRCMVSMGLAVVICDFMEKRPCPELLAEAVSVAGVAMVLLFTLVPVPDRNDALYLFMVALGAATVGLLRTDVAVARLLGSPIFKMLGTLSFSIYLLHVPVIYLLVNLVKIDSSQHGFVWAVHLSMVLTVILSYFTYRYVELPFIRLGHRVEKWGVQRKEKRLARLAADDLA